ncbi:MAG: Cna B-type domain-containing protein, partial [Clostridiales bacterium]|nr:Cna B-type domain-containing protein [Clostridiales bacterium]
MTEDQATAQVDGYDLTVTGSGESKAVAENATASFTIHNEYTRETGNLTIAKTATGAAVPEGATFTITGPDGNETTVTYGDFTDGRYTLTDLPTGNYTVTEDQATAQVDGYDLTVTGSGESKAVAENATASFAIHNEYTRETGNLTIAKTSENASVPEGATFTITGPEGYSKTVTYSDFTDGSYTLTDLSTGNYTVTEDQATAQVDGYDLTVSGSGESRAVAENATASFTIHNEYTRETGNLTIAKTSENASVPEGATFTITGPEGYSKTVTYSDFTDGSYTLTDLPTGNYTVTEDQATAQVDGYDLTVSGSGESRAVAENATASFTIHNEYTRETGNLTIAKTATGASVPEGATFTITGPEEYSKTVTYSDFTDGSYTLTDLPTGNYTVTEDQATAQVDGYDLTVSGSGESKAVAENATASFTIHNEYTRETGSLTIAKVIPSATSSMANDAFSFIISGPADWTGSVSYAIGQQNGTAHVQDGKITIDGIKHNDVLTLSSIPSGIYTATEAESEGNTYTYTPSYTVNGADAEMAAVNVLQNNIAAVTITNTPKMGGLKIRKTVTDYSYLIKNNDQFSFQISGRLPETVSCSINGGGATVLAPADGLLTVSGIKHGDTVILSGLPEGDFVITESMADTNLYTYVSSIPAQGSTVSVMDGNQSELAVINEPEKQTLSFSKQWEGTPPVALDDFIEHYLLLYQKYGQEEWAYSSGYAPNETGASAADTWQFTYSYLPKGYTFIMSENPVTGYKPTVQDSAYDASVTINGTKYPAVSAGGTLYNAKTRGSLQLTKQVIDTSFANGAKSFIFYITPEEGIVDECGGENWNAEMGCYEVTIVVSEPVKNYTLTLDELPKGSYTITEKPTEGYSISPAEGVTVTITDTDTATATFVNTALTGDLTIVKSAGIDVALNEQMQADSFTFEVDVPSVYAEGASFAALHNGASADAVVKNGKLTFTGVHFGDSISIQDLPIGSYTIREIYAENNAYTYTNNLTAQNTVQVEAGNSADFTVVNTPEVTTAQISKTWVGDNAAVRPSAEEFAAALTLVGVPADGESVVITSAPSVESSGNIDVYSWSNLSSRYTYYVVEDVPEGYLLTSQAAKAVLLDGKTVNLYSALTNELTKGELEVTKILVNPVITTDDGDVSFAFIVKSTDSDTHKWMQNEAAYSAADDGLRLEIPVSAASLTQSVSIRLLPGSYTVEEIEIPDGYTVSPAVPVSVTVTADSKTSAAFTNTYTASGEIQFTGTKTLNGMDLTADQFSFVLSGEDVNETVKNAADGSITFSKIVYDETDIGKTYTYTVKEQAGNVYGMSYDDTEYTIEVTVSDAGNGKLNIEASENHNALNFTNGYNYTASGEIQFMGTKTLNGMDLTAEQFSFVLSGEDVNETVKNAADGSITFSKIVYDESDIGKTYTYTVKEQAGSVYGMSYDDTEYTIEVTVSDAGNGKLDIVATDNYNALDFTNNYQYTASGEIQFTGTKTLNGMDLTADQFSFVLSGEDVNETVKNAADGSITFSKIVYDESDIGKTYTYTVKEQAGNVYGMTYDDTVYTIEVTVSDAGNGKLDVVATDNYNALDFTNNYQYTASGEIQFTGTKTLNGMDLTADQFSFVLSGDGVNETVKNAADGSITFSKIVYDESDIGKTYTY